VKAVIVIDYHVTGLLQAVQSVIVCSSKLFVYSSYSLD